MSCLPEHLEGRRYYEPTDSGLEARIKEALERARRLRRAVAEAADGTDRGKPS
jgi:replication-associated recombination protein RarA